MTDTFAHKAAGWDQPDKIRMSNKFVAELLKHIDLQPHWKALEIGAGTGLVGLQLLPHLKSCVFVDTSKAMLSILHDKVKDIPNVEILHGEVSEYIPSDINLVFSNMAFHHIEDIEATLQHLHTITKPGARVVVGDLRSEDGSFHHFEAVPHRGFETNELAGLFRQSGFEVQLIKTYNILHREESPGNPTYYELFILIAVRRDS